MSKVSWPSASWSEVKVAAEAGTVSQARLKAGRLMHTGNLGSSAAPLVLLAAWVSRELLAPLVANSSKSERLWRLLSSLCFAFWILLKMEELLWEPESSSSESEFLPLQSDTEKGGMEGGRVGENYNYWKILPCRRLFKIQIWRVKLKRHFFSSYRDFIGTKWKMNLSLSLS